VTAGAIKPPGKAPVVGGTTAKRRGWGWLLLLPGMLYLAVFFLFPTVQLFLTSLYDPSGSYEQGYSLTWHFANYADAIKDNWNLFLRSFTYAGIATVVCLVLGYPLAYAIAFKAGRWKYFMLVLVIAPFFTSFLLRTLAWRTILSDQGPVTSFFQLVGLLPDDGRLLATPFAVIAGLIYNFLPFMTLPLYASLDKVDYRLIEAAGHVADVHPRLRRLHQRRAARHSQAVHGRQPDPGGLPHRAQLPAGRQPVADPDGGRDGDGDRLRPPGRDRGTGLMASTTTRTQVSPEPVRARPAKRPRGRWLSDHLVLFVGILVLVYTFVPIGYIFALSFNQPSGRSATAQFESFTWGNWTSICEPEGLCESVKLSFQVSITATVLATVLGTLMAFALVRHRFRGRATSNLVVFLPMATPEVVLGSSLLAMFVSVGLDSVLGFITLVIAHVLFCLSFVVVTVKARLVGMDARLEQAAMDLYANEWQTFRLITLPLAMPGIVAAAMLSFSLSFDDFIVTNFTAGQSVTFPLFIYGSKLKDFPPQLFVVGTLMFLISFVLVIAAEVWRRQRARSLR
jgi:spermidine/putrescine transport system permease protein